MTVEKPKILIVDDGNRYVELAHALLRDYSYATRCELGGPCWDCDISKGCSLTHAHDWSETVQALERHPDVDVVLLDIVFDISKERLLMRADEDLERSRRLQGIEILGRLRKRYGRIPVVLMTSMEELAFEDAAEALEVDEFVTMAGATAFDARALGLLVERILARSREVSEGADYLWGRSRAMARLRRDALSLARTSLPILLLGQTGTGKSALAEQILHPATQRKGPFVALDLATIPETLLAAELFGSVRGAFSGAIDRPGCFEQADGGTLFLDEIGNLPLDVQRMLLVTLQNGRVTRLGQARHREVDVKLIAATNADIVDGVRQGRFRADLYARLNPAARLQLPLLEDRNKDIGALARFFVQQTFQKGRDHALLSTYMKTAGLDGPTMATLTIGRPDKPVKEGIGFVLSRRTLKELLAHDWPGNIRELRLLMANAAIFALSDALGGAEQGRAAASTAARTIPIPSKLVRELLNAYKLDGEPVVSKKGQGMRLQIKAKESLRAMTRELERQVMQQLFRETDGDFAKMAAKLLKGDPGINERRVRLRFNQLGLRARTMRKKST